MFALLLTLAIAVPTPPEEPASAEQALAQADDDRLEEDLPPPPPPLPLEEEEGASEAGEETAPPPPPLPTDEPLDPYAQDPYSRSVPEAPSTADEMKPVNGFLAAAIAAGTGAVLALPAAGCCSCCGIFGCWAPPVCGALGSGGGAALGAVLAGVPLTDALLPAGGAAALGLVGGLVALPCGLATSAAVLALLTGGISLQTGAVNTGPGLIASAASGLVVLLVMIAGSASAGGLAWVLLPDEVPVTAKEKPKAVRNETPAPVVRVSQAIAF